METPANGGVGGQQLKDGNGLCRVFRSGYTGGHCAVGERASERPTIFFSLASSAFASHSPR